MQEFRFVVVGSGYAGSVISRLLADHFSNDNILVIEIKNHIGGHSYDKFNEYGILIHKYGPHIFHTNYKEVFDYLGKFTSWLNYQHRVLTSINGQLLPIPINLDTINEYFGLNLNTFEVQQFLDKLAEKKEEINNSEDAVVSKIGRELYEKFFKFYTIKQWDKDPSELDKSVLSRIPVRTNRDDRYFSDKYQAMPKEGYTNMFENMLNHPRIKILLQSDYFEIKENFNPALTIYTGPIDRFFNYKFGKLQYRSLRFEWETYNQDFYQKAAVINYPNDYDFTRITEYKYLTGQKHQKTTISKEFPTWDGDPYYPVSSKENQELYLKYKEEADKTKNVIFLGRLAEYKYYNMDHVVKKALDVFKEIKDKFSK